MISEKNIEKVKRMIKEAERPVIIDAQDDIFNRKILEYGKFDILLSPEEGERRNSVRQLDSGLNYVLAKAASKNEVAIGINFEGIKNLGKKEKAERLAKVIQNIAICRKSKTTLAVRPLNLKTKSLLLTLGASTQQIKKAISF